MKTAYKIFVVALVALAVGFVLYAKEKNDGEAIKGVEPGKVTTTTRAALVPKSGLPRLLDLGSDSCLPCKMMVPVLEELTQEYQGRLEVDFVDVWKSRQEAEKFNISIIPTQIFFDAEGTELFRHEGYFSKEEILAKWKELGFDLGSGKK